MSELLMNPAFQAGVAPFAAALLGILLLKRLGWYWAGLALIAGFAVTVYLVTGFQFQPWTSTRKLIALGLGAAALGLLLDLYPWGRRAVTAAVFGAGAAAALWVIWPVLQRQEGWQGWLLAAGMAAYVGWCASAMESLRTDAAGASGAALVLGFGTGASALFGASALLGQLGIAVGAAAAALWLTAAFARKMEIGSTATLPAGLLAGLIGGAGHVYSQVPWYSLAVLALVPLLARVPMPGWMPGWLRAVSLLVVCAVAGAAAAWIALREGGAPPL